MLFQTKWLLKVYVQKASHVFPNTNDSGNMIWKDLRRIVTCERPSSCPAVSSQSWPYTWNIKNIRIHLYMLWLYQLPRKVDNTDGRGQEILPLPPRSQYIYQIEYFWFSQIWAPGQLLRGGKHWSPLPASSSPSRLATFILQVFGPWSPQFMERRESPEAFGIQQVKQECSL